MIDEDQLAEGSYEPPSSGVAGLTTASKTWLTVAAVAVYSTRVLWQKLLMLGKSDAKEGDEQAEIEDIELLNATGKANCKTHNAESQGSLNKESTGNPPMKSLSQSKSQLNINLSTGLQLLDAS